MASTGLQIACFSMNYPPLKDSEAYVTQKWVAALRSADHHVEVFSLVGGEVPTGRLRRACGNARALIGGLVPLLKHELFDLSDCRRLVSYVPNAIALFEKSNREKKFDIIVSRYEPIASCIAAYYVRQKWAIPWVACYNDPVPRISRPRQGLMRLVDLHRNSFQQRWLLRILTTPDALVFPCRELRDSVLSHFHQLCRRAGAPTKVALIPHLGGRMAQEAPSLQSGSRDVPTLRHLGYLSEARDVRALLDALRLWDEAADCGPLNVEFVGRVDAQRARLEAFAVANHRKVGVSICPEVDYDSALGLMESATACLLIEMDADRSIFLPSKFCDYAAAMRPILAISPAESPVSKYLRSAGGGLAVPHDPGVIFDALKRVLCGRATPSRELSEMFGVKQVGRQWTELLDGVVHARASRSQATAGGVSQ